MADVQTAVMDVMREEDSTLSGVITDTRGDRGGKTRFGLASKWHPELVASTFYTTMSTADGLKVAELAMTAAYALPMRIADIEDQGLAVKFLSFGVNVGTGKAARTMQYAINLVCPGSTLAVEIDSLCGPATIVAMNRCMAQSLLNSFRLRMIGYYNSICRADKEQMEFLCGWIDRSLA